MSSYGRHCLVEHKHGGETFSAISDVQHMRLNHHTAMYASGWWKSLVSFSLKVLAFPMQSERK